jgi:hypothetical protein
MKADDTVVVTVRMPRWLRDDLRREAALRTLRNNPTNMNRLCLDAIKAIDWHVDEAPPAGREQTP